MGQVCYILRYCLFLYLYSVTGLYGSWDRFAIYCATVFSYIFTGLLICMVYGAGLLFTTLLSFPLSLQGNGSVWFMGQVCYILRYCLFLYLHRVTGLYGSWAGLLYTALLSFPISFQGNWSIWFMGQACYILRYYLFLYLYRVTGLYGSWNRFAIYCATVFFYIFTG